MNVVDSSAWLEYFANGPGAGFFAPAIEDSARLVVPTICLLEVFKRVLQQKGEGAALQAVALMQQGQVQTMDSGIAIRAARLGVAHKLPLADSVVLAVARQHEALLWTQDADFEGLDNVRYLPKGRAR
ncbi:MAG: type II toxin-antitoxin system VapC family toxin [Candidatus Rokubacteria bacterium]|nr:type II toxin-antitoxin system VapC family toxin [Candidatus Rokubacteria bacterium]MBI3107304.1 type II toxin-antitoxin system VapC family toxin [Candidatus Rokubacteria bacterium]